VTMSLKRTGKPYPKDSVPSSLSSPSSSYNSLPPSPFHNIDVDQMEQDERSKTLILALVSVAIVIILTLTLFTVLLR